MAVPCIRGQAPGELAKAGGSATGALAIKQTHPPRPKPRLSASMNSTTHSAPSPRSTGRQAPGWRVPPPAALPRPAGTPESACSQHSWSNRCGGRWVEEKLRREPAESFIIAAVPITVSTQLQRPPCAPPKQCNTELLTANSVRQPQSVLAKASRALLQLFQVGTALTLGSWRSPSRRCRSAPCCGVAARLQGMSCGAAGGWAEVPARHRASPHDSLARLTACVPLPLPIVDLRTNPAAPLPTFRSPSGLPIQVYAQPWRSGSSAPNASLSNCGLVRLRGAVRT